MPVVPDASPLIVLGKLERADLLPELYGNVIVTPGVWDEAVTKGKAMGARDAAYLEKFAREHGFTRSGLAAKEKELVQQLRDEAGVGLWEAEVLAVAKSRNAVALLDEKGARAAAVGLGVLHIGTAGVLYEAFVRGVLGYEELVELMEGLGRVAWISPELLAGILRRAREREKK